MRLMLHTFKKDVRRLWPAAAVTWVMLAAMANADCWRADWIPSPMEGWMNLLLTMAWVCLAALAVLEEPLVGDRNFWTTRPHRWPALLAAKLVFVVLAIHLPSLLADLFVLTARGFPPAAHLGDLLWKQMLFFGTVTLPSIALASLVRDFTHFIIAGFTIAAGIAILNGGFQSFPEFRGQQSEVRHAAVRILLAVAALAVIWTQYARRRVIPAPVMAIAAALAAASLSAWLPARAEYAVRSRGSRETPRIALRSAPNDEAVIGARAGGMQPAVLLPIAISPGAHGDLIHIPIVQVEIVAPDGTRLQSISPSPNRPFEKIDLMAYPFSTSRDRPPDWLAFRFSSAVWERVKNARVRVRGTAAFEFYRRGETAILPAQGSGNVPDLGRCTALTVDDRFSEEMLKVLCESPRDLPAASITLRHEPSGREWREGLNSSVTYSPGPHETWLSPLHRGQSFFRVTNSVTSVPGSQWLVPMSYLSSARVEITPEIVSGHALAGFDFGEVTLASWLVPH
jgi:hypothetical protein